ncbi:helix-turn-helix domain-containing protein [Paenibacillus donghaensis]|uniref:DNA-binding protein n=1 Tax=Paenibacillus donghaensis TaxID=414771 RepID=A0A2Z2KGJ3_9BACL|nr:helix-turn-helix domain-containing protein [Paenibacillus donghaensis]ASA21279.1 DNA-binding protein [Paenibacillus donghaensis]
MTRTEKLLPPVLSPADIQKFLGIGENKAYELLASSQFHVARVGRRLFVSRTVFIEWLEGKSEAKEVNRRK